MKEKNIVAKRQPKNTLRLPDLDQAKSAVLNSAIKGVAAGVSAWCYCEKGPAVVAKDLPMAGDQGGRPDRRSEQRRDATLKVNRVGVNASPS